MERDRLIELHLEGLAVLGCSLSSSSRDALDDLCKGGLLTTLQAAKICEVSDQAIRDWIEHAASTGQHIAEKRTTWIIGTQRLFAYIQAHRGGFPARVKAQCRFEELWRQWSKPQELPTGTKVAGGTSAERAEQSALLHGGPSSLTL